MRLNWLVKAIKTSRPVMWWAILMPFIVGISSGGENSILQLKFIAPAILLAFPYSLFVYSINDYYDSKSDELNPRKGGVFGLKYKRENLNQLKLFSLVGFLVTLVGWLLISKAVVGAYLLTSVLLYYYSAKPVRFKEIPGLDFLVGGGILFMSPGLFGYLMTGGMIESLLNDFPESLFSLFVAGMMVHLIGAIFDIKYDKLAKMMTSAVFFGYRKVIWFGIGVSLLSAYLVREKWFYSLALVFFGGLAGLQLFQKVRESEFFKKVVSEWIIYAFFLLVFSVALVKIDLLR